MDKDQQVFRLRDNTQGLPSATMIVVARGREDAKRKARRVLGMDPDQYEVEPVTNPGESCYLVWE